MVKRKKAWLRKTAIEDNRADLGTTKPSGQVKMEELVESCGCFPLTHKLDNLEDVGARTEPRWGCGDAAGWIRTAVVSGNGMCQISFLVRMFTENTECGCRLAVGRRWEYAIRSRLSVPGVVLSFADVQLI
eukprot:5801276-Amphidinium_carterae.1